MMDDYADLIEYLREMHDVMLYDDSVESGISEEMITDIDAIACKEAADAIEQLVKERDNIIGVANKLGKRCGACDICGADCPLSHNRDYLPGDCEHWKLGIERSETDVR